MYVKSEKMYFFAEDWPRKKICKEIILPHPHKIKWTVPKHLEQVWAVVDEENVCILDGSQVDVVKITVFV